MSKPKYKYAPHGAWWYVWEVTYYKNGSGASKISEPMEKEEARKETYRLNGWEYKAPTN